MHKFSSNTSTSKPSPSSGGNITNSIANCSNFGMKNKSNICQWCNKRGHTAHFCFKIANNLNVKPHANAVTISLCQNYWLLDYGASHHITNDFSNLFLHHECQAPIILLLLMVIRYPFPMLVLPHCTHISSLQPSDVLYVPQVNQNKVSVFSLLF